MQPSELPETGARQLATTEPFSPTRPRRSCAEVVYTALNAYAGMIGEVLGVGFFAAAWLVLISYKILQTRVLPR